MRKLISLVQALFDAETRHLRRASRFKEKESFHAAYSAYQKAADRGSIEAMLALAQMHERGEGTPMSLPHALEWYRAAAKLGDVEGHFGAGSCLMRMERIPRGMRSWYQSVSEREPERAAELGALLGAKMDLDDPYALAREHLTEACWQGHAEAHYRLAELLVRGLGGETDAARAHDLYLVAAAESIPGAEYGLGELYRLGNGCTADSETASGWYKRAATGGHLSAQLIMAQHCMAKGEIEEARRWLRLGLEQGAPHADFLLAVIELSPLVADRDESKGKQHLRRAAAKGHLYAMKRLGQIYDEGLFGEARDEMEAAGWYKKAAEGGDLESQFVIGRMYARGEGVPQMSTSAARWFARSAEAGHTIAQYNYAIFLERGEGIPADPQAALAMLEEAAAGGLAAAQFKLGRDLLRDQPAQRGGVDWLEKSAAQNHVGALAFLGLLYARGEHVTKDMAKAADHLQRAASLGHVASRVHLAGLLRAEGAPIEDVLDALLTAAKDGSAEAELALARMHFSGDGVDVDVPAAVAWLEKAVAHGHPQALFELGVRHCRGEGLPQDPARGTQFYRRAAEAGHIIGRYNYAVMVLGGHVDDGDMVLAKRYLREAALGGLKEAEEACQIYQVEDGIGHEVEDSGSANEGSARA